MKSMADGRSASSSPILTLSSQLRIYICLYRQVRIYSIRHPCHLANNVKATLMLLSNCAFFRQVTASFS